MSRSKIVHVACHSDARGALQAFAIRAPEQPSTVVIPTRERSETGGIPTRSTGVGKGTTPQVVERLADAGSTVEERRFSAA